MLLCLAYLFSNAQHFELTEKGLVSLKDKDAKFIVIEKEGKSQKELYDQIKNFIMYSFVSPKDVISENGTDMITLNGVSNGDVECKKGFVMLPFKTNYTIVFMFKDGKIRINIPTINKMTSESTTLGGDLSGLYELTLTKDDPVSTGREQIVVFKKDGKTTKGAKESIEKLFNTLIDKAINFTSTAKEEW